MTIVNQLENYSEDKLIYLETTHIQMSGHKTFVLEVMDLTSYLQYDENKIVLATNMGDSRKANRRE